MHLNVNWGILGAAVLLVILMGNKHAWARFAGMAIAVCGIFWGVYTKDYGLIPFNVIVILIGGLEMWKAQRESAEIVDMPERKNGRRVA